MTNQCVIDLNTYALFSDDPDMPEPEVVTKMSVNKMESKDSLKENLAGAVKVRSINDPWGKQAVNSEKLLAEEEGFKKIKNGKKGKGKQAKEVHDQEIMVDVVKPVVERTIPIGERQSSLMKMLNNGSKTRGIVLMSEINQNVSYEKFGSGSYDKDMIVIRLASSKTDEYKRERTIVAGPFKGKGPFVFYIRHATEDVIRVMKGDISFQKIRIETTKYSITRFGDKCIITCFLKDGTLGQNAAMYECSNDGSQVKGIFQWSVAISSYVRNIRDDNGLADELQVSSEKVLLKEISVKKHYYVEKHGRGESMGQKYKSILSTPSSKDCIFVKAILAMEKEQETIVIEKIKKDLRNRNISAIYQRDYEVITDERIVGAIEAYYKSINFDFNNSSRALMRATEAAVVKEKMVKQMMVISNYLVSNDVEMPVGFEEQKTFLMRDNIQDFMIDATSSWLAEDSLKNAWTEISLVIASNMSEEKKLCSLVCTDDNKTLDKKLLKCHFGTVFAEIFAGLKISSSFDHTIMGKETVSVDSLKKKFGVVELIQRLAPNSAFSKLDYARVSKSELFNSILYRIPEMFECYKILYGLFWTNVFVKTTENEDTQKKFEIMRERFEQAFTGIIKDCLERNVSAKISKDKNEEKVEAKEQSSVLDNFYKDRGGVRHASGTKKIEELPRFSNFFDKEKGKLEEGKFNIFLSESTIHFPTVYEHFKHLMTYVGTASPENKEFQRFMKEDYGKLLGNHKDTMYSPATRDFLAKEGIMSGSSASGLSVLKDNISWLKVQVEIMISPMSVSDRKKIENKVMEDALATNFNILKTKLVVDEKKKIDEEFCGKVAFFQLASNTVLNVFTVLTEMKKKSDDYIKKKTIQYNTKELTIEEEKNFEKEKDNSKSCDIMCIRVTELKEKIATSYDIILGVMNGKKGLIPQLASVKSILVKVLEIFDPEEEQDKKKKNEKRAKNTAASIKSKHAFEKTLGEATDMNLRATVLKKKISNIHADSSITKEQKMEQILKELKPLISYYDYNDMTIFNIVKEIMEWIETSLNDRVEKKTNHGYEFTQKLGLLVETMFNTGRLQNVEEYKKFEVKFATFVNGEITLDRFWAFHCALIETDAMTVMQGSLGLKPSQHVINKWFFDKCTEEECKVDRNLLIGLPTGFGKTSTIMEFIKILPVLNKIRISKKQPIVNVLFVAYGDHSVISANFIKSTEANSDQAIYYSTTTIKNSTKSLEGGRVVSGESKWLNKTNEWYEGTKDQCWIVIYDELMSITRKDRKLVHKVTKECTILGTVHMSGTIGNVENVKGAISNLYGGTVLFVDAPEGRVIRPVNSVFTKDSIERFIALNPIDWSLSDIWMLFEHVKNYKSDNSDELSAKAQVEVLMNEVVKLRNLGRINALPALTQIKLNEIAFALDKIMNDNPCLKWTNPEAVFPSMSTVVENIVVKNDEKPMQAAVISGTPQFHAYEFVKCLISRMHVEYPFTEKELEKIARYFKTEYDRFSPEFRSALGKSSNGVADYVPSASSHVDRDGVVSKKSDELDEMAQQFMKFNASWANNVVQIKKEFDIIKYQLEHGGVLKKEEEGYKNMDYFDSGDDSDFEEPESSSSSSEVKCSDLKGKTSDPVLLQKQLAYLDSIIGLFLNGRIYNDYHDIDGKLTWSFIPLEYQFGTKNLCGGGIQHKLAASIYGLNKEAYIESYMHLSNHGIMVLPDDSNQIPTNPNCAMNDANFYKAICHLTGIDGVPPSVGLIFCGNRGSVGLNVNFACVIYLGDGTNHKQALGRCGRQGMRSDACTISVRPVPDHTEVASQSFSLHEEDTSNKDLVQLFELFSPFTKKEKKIIKVKEVEKFVAKYVDCAEDVNKDKLVLLKPKEVKEVEIKEEVPVNNPWTKTTVQSRPSMIDATVSSKKEQRRINNNNNQTLTLSTFMLEQNSPLPSSVISQEQLLAEKREKEKNLVLEKYQIALGKNQFPFRIVFPPAGLYY